MSSLSLSQVFQHVGELLRWFWFWFLDALGTDREHPCHDMYFFCIIVVISLVLLLLSCCRCCCCRCCCPCLESYQPTKRIELGLRNAESHSLCWVLFFPWLLQRPRRFCCRSTQKGLLRRVSCTTDLESFDV